MINNECLPNVKDNSFSVQCFPQIPEEDKSLFTANELTFKVPLFKYKDTVPVYAKNAPILENVEFEQETEDGVANVKEILTGDRGATGVGLKDIEFHSKGADYPYLDIEKVLIPEKGDKGDKGDKGADGIDGKDANIDEVSNLVINRVKPSFLSKDTYDPERVGRDVYNRDNHSNGKTYIGFSVSDKDRLTRAEISPKIQGLKPNEKAIKFYTQDNASNGFMRNLIENFYGKDAGSYPTWYLPSGSGNQFYQWDTGIISVKKSFDNTGNENTLPKSFFRVKLDRANKQIELYQKNNFVSFYMTHMNTIGYSSKNVIILKPVKNSNSWWGTIQNPLFKIWICVDFETGEMVCSGNQHLLMSRMPNDIIYNEGETA